MAVEITTWAELAAINSGLSGDYILMNDLGSSDTGYDTYASSSANGGSGWTPLGNSSIQFTGNFEGNYFSISDIYISVASNVNHIGFFGYINGATVQNFKIVNIDIYGGDDYQGGLIGYGQSSFIIKCSVSGSLVSADNFVGGFVGYCKGTSITDSYNHVNINSVGTVYAAGMIGYATSTPTITNSYSNGAVLNISSGAGGLIGYGTSTVINCFWDTETSTRATSSGGVGLTTSESKDITSYTNWDIVAVDSKADGFANHSFIWNIVDGSTYPFLSWEFTEGSGPTIINPKIKIGGTFSTKVIKVKIGGTFIEKTQKVKVGGTFQ